MATCTDQIATADTSGVELRYVTEECWGEETDLTAADGKQLQKLRFTSESLGLDRSTVVSDEINSDRQISDLIPTNFSAVGDINGEWSTDTYDDFIGSALCSQWADADEDMLWVDHEVDAWINVGGGLRFSVPADAPRLADGTTLLQVGQKITLSGFSTAGNNGEKTIATSSDAVMTFSETMTQEGDATNKKPVTIKSSVITGVSVDNGELVVPTKYNPINGLLYQTIQLKNLSAANNIRVTVTGEREDGTNTRHTVTPSLTTQAATTAHASHFDVVSSTKNGSEEISFYIEKEFSDIADGTDKRILSYSGMVVDQMSIALEAEAKSTIRFSLLGKSSADRTATLIDDPADATSTDIISSSITGETNIVWDGGSTDESIIKSISIDTSNNYRNKTVIGQLGSIDVGKGRFSVTGSISLYLSDFDIYSRFLDNESFSLAFTLGGDGKDGYSFLMPKVKITNSSIVAGGPDQDVMVDIGYQALGSGSTKTLYISKVDA